MVVAMDQHGEGDAAGLRTLYDAAGHRGTGDVDRGFIELCADVLATDYADDLLGARDRIVYSHAVAALIECEHLTTDEARRRASSIAVRASLRAQEILDERAEREAEARELARSARPAEINRGGPWSAAEAAHEFVGAAEPEAHFLDENRTLSPAAITELFSPRGLGKTLYALLLAVLLALTGKRILYVNRDNPRHEVRRRLRACGVTAEQALNALKVITREKAPPLTDAAAWRMFPIAEYDVVILDSFDSAAEGVGEQDSAKPSRAIAPLLDVARAMNGPAVLVLGNVIKSGAHSRCSGVIEDRADIVFEVRDATDLKPTGTKAWWEELPPAGADSWAQRATRRKRRDKYLLAFVPSKFRLGEEPDPFVIELDLSAEPWTMRNATAELIAAGDTARQTADQERRAKIEVAAAALHEHLKRCAAAGKVLLAERDAVPFLRQRGLTRDQARELIATAEGKSWRSQITEGRGNPVALVPMQSPATTAENDGSGKPQRTGLFEAPISADRMGQAPPKSDGAKPLPEAGSRDGPFPRRTSPKHPNGCSCEACTPVPREVLEV